MRGTVLLLLVLIQLWCIQFAIAINYYKQGDSVPVYFNKIFSLQNPLAYSYSHLSFVCPTQQDARRKSWLVFDQDLRGVRPVQSDYKVELNPPRFFFEINLKLLD